MLLPTALTDDRSNAASTGSLGHLESGALRTGESGRHQSDFAIAASGEAAGRHVPGAVGLRRVRLREAIDQIATSCEVLSVIPATFEQDQFSFNLDQQVVDANRLSGKFFFSNQPSRDPLGDSAALTLHEREETTYQRTLSFSDVHVFARAWSTRCAAGFFRNRNDSVAVAYFTNAEFGIQNPFADQVPDLSQITIDGDDVGGELRFGTLGDGTRIFDRQTTWTQATRCRSRAARHSLRVGGELRRHFLDGDLQETRNRRHNFDSWMDFMTVGYTNPGDRNRARQIADTSLN